MNIEHCRSCGAEIVWMKTALGKSAPVDAKTVTLEDRAKNGTFDPKRHTSHFATCPQSDQWKRKDAEPKKAERLCEARIREIIGEEIRKSLRNGGEIRQAILKAMPQNVTGQGQLL